MCWSFLASPFFFSKIATCDRLSVVIVRMSTRPFPIPGLFTQTRFNRILMDIFYCFAKMFFISNIAVPVFPHPKSFSRYSQTQTSIMGKSPASSKCFPGVDDLWQRCSLPNQDMDVVGHDAPGKNVVFYPVEMQQCILHCFRHLRMLQGATPHTGIQPILNLLSPLYFSCAFRCFFQFLLQLNQHFPGQGICKTKGYGLQGSVVIKMGHIATAIASLWIMFFGIGRHRVINNRLWVLLTPSSSSASSLPLSAGLEPGAPG